MHGGRNADARKFDALTKTPNAVEHTTCNRYASLKSLRSMRNCTKIKPIKTAVVQIPISVFRMSLITDGMEFTGETPSRDAFETETPSAKINRPVRYVMIRFP